MAQLDNAYQPSLVPKQNSGHDRLQWTTRENGALVVYAKEPAPSIWRRIMTHLLAWLPVRREL